MQNLFYITGFTILSFFSFFTNNEKETVSNEISSEAITVNSPPDCLGERAVLRRFYYNDIPANYIRSIYNHTQYPQVPTGMYFLEGLEMSNYFNDYYGSVVRGYLLAPETGDYLFNVTGDNWIDFNFNKELDQHPDSLNTIAYTENATSITEHTKYPGQTSELIPMEAGTYYYFELVTKEAAYSDFAKVYWKIPSVINGDWVDIDTTYLYDYTCETICSPLGTPCDDGDASTMDDIEDGFCNCNGRSTTSNDCIGERSTISALYYDDLEGRFIANLDTAAIFPESPTRAEILTDFRGTLYNGDYYGVYVRTYLSVPVTGEYIFNLTADYEARLWMSSGESSDPSDLTELCDVYRWTYDGEHEKYEEQTSAPITLQAGQYYYMEFKMKEELYQDHFTVWWKTPFATNDDWQVVSGAYLYQYNCESACIPANTACDDGDPSTVNDLYDENCNCVGTPCDFCDEAEEYVVYEVCNLTDQHSNQVDSWQSCDRSMNPISSRGEGHWIMYDLQEMYQIHDTHIWNYNKANETGKGLKDVAIDVSLDGITWTQVVQPMTWPQASGVLDYEGFTGFDFNGRAARYVLITALSNWNGDDCSGFSELKMNIEACPGANTPCDDENPNTLDDAYDEFCVCKGISDGTLALDLLSFDANWDKQNVLVEWAVENEETNTYYEVQRSLDAKNFESIGLLAGKAVNQNKTNYQLVDTKGYQLANELFYRLKMIENAGQERFSHMVSLRQADNANRLEINAIQPNPFKESLQIEFTVPENNSKLQLKIFNGQGRFIRSLVDEQASQGQYQISWNGTDASGKEVEAGIYYLQLTDGRQRIGRRVVKL